MIGIALAIFFGTLIIAAIILAILAMTKKDKFGEESKYVLEPVPKKTPSPLPVPKKTPSPLPVPKKTPLPPSLSPENKFNGLITILYNSKDSLDSKINNAYDYVRTTNMSPQEKEQLSNALRILNNKSEITSNNLLYNLYSRTLAMLNMFRDPYEMIEYIWRSEDSPNNILKNVDDYVSKNKMTKTAVDRTKTALMVMYRRNYEKLNDNFNKTLDSLSKYRE